MARSASLKRVGLARRLLPILAAVLLAHALVFEWLARQQIEISALRPLATPMFTRMLQPQAPPPSPVYEPKQAIARSPRARDAINSIAISASSPAPTSTVAALDEPAGMPPAQVSAKQTPPAEAAASIGPPAADTEGASASATATPTDMARATISVAALDDWPSDTRLHYRLSGQFRSGELHGDASVQWQRQGSRYQSRIEIDLPLLASLVLTSQGEVTPAGLMPRAYEELRRGKNRGARLGETVIILADGRTVPRPEGVQDSASQFVELSHRFASGRELLEVGRSVSFWLARPGAVDLWTYDIVEREMLQTSQLGEIEAFRLKPRPIANPRGNITAEMWFAPSLQYLPVRIRVSMGDATYVDLLVDRIEQR